MGKETLMFYFKYTVLLTVLFSTSVFAADSLAYKGSDGFKLYKQDQGSDYYFESNKHKFVIHAGPSDSLDSSLKRLQGDLMFEYPKNWQEHYQQISKIILRDIEQTFRFAPPTDEELVKKSQQISDVITSEDADDRCIGQDIAYDPDKKIGYLNYLDITLDRESDALVRQRIVKEKLKQEGFFDLGELKGVRISWDTLNDNFGHGIYHAINGTKMYDEKPWFEGDDRGLTFGTAEGGTMIFEKGEVKVEHYSKAYTRIAPQSRKYTINGREYTSQFVRDEEGKYYQEMLAVDGLLIELKKDIGSHKLYYKVAGRVEKTSSNGLAATLQKSWHELDKKNTIQYHNISVPEKEHLAYSSEGALGKSYEGKLHNWLGVRGTIEGRGGLSSELKEESFVSLDAEIVVHSNSWRRDTPVTKERPAAVEASLYAGQKRYFNGESYDRLGVRVTGNILVSDSDVVGVYAGMGTEEDPHSKAMGSYELSTRGRVDVTHFYGINWTHYY